MSIHKRDPDALNAQSKALRASEIRYRRLFESAKDGILILDAETGRIVDVNPFLVELLGISRNGFLEKKIWELGFFKDILANEEKFNELQAHEYVRYEDLPLKSFDGRAIAVEFVSNVYMVGDQRVIQCNIRDITERKHSEEELHEQERLLSESQRLGHLGSWLMRASGSSKWSEEFYRLLGLSPNEFPPTFELLFSVIHPDDRHLMQAWVDASMAGEKPEELDFRVNMPGGTIRYIRGRGESVFNANNEFSHMAGTAQDVTQYKNAEEEKAKLQKQLQQAQKMESVGRLAGGVAHDFNNMLGVILGHAELALQGITPEHPLHDSLMEIHNAANRSASLTRQLLAFASRQTIAPKVLDLNQTVTEMLNMLQRLLGEDVSLKWHPFQNLWHVMIDPSQIDQILANLCVNARDAIKSGGTITIETGNSTLDEVYCSTHMGAIPGEYVTLALSDDGCGMDKETMAQIFEPFFTTKGVGKGTGLGLSTIYGIIKQNKGIIEVYSEIGHGTTFTMYLPRYIGNADPARGTKEKTPPAKGGNETILLVEDEPGILKMTTGMLKMQGYTVLAASTPGEALRLAEEHSSEIHLLMTDVVMPEMNGQDLAKNLLSLYPQIKQLFMSGYTSDIITRHGILNEGVHFIQKPFALKSLTARIREVLDKA
jgi:two-component system cell cycle sensor histidine kinase/response regulator CckA